MIKTFNKQSAFIKTSFGTLQIVASLNGINSIKKIDNKKRIYSSLKSSSYHKIMQKTIEHLHEYFLGTRKEFNIPIVLKTTQFYEKALLAVLEIPFGEIRTYKSIAKISGNEKGSRAVGTANSKNPIPIIIPCHRVIPSNGSIGNYRYGRKAKKDLLEHEGHSFNGDLFFN